MRIYHGDSINTLYAVLDLPETADQAEIKSARNRLIRKYHPDKISTNFKGTRRDAEAKTRLIIEAYAVLGNNRERCQYDEWLSSQRSQPEPGTFDFSFDEEDTSSFSEDIEEEEEEEIPVQQKKKKAKSKTKKKSTRKTVKREQPFFSNTECTPDPRWKNIEPETYIAILIFVIYPAVTAGAWWVIFKVTTFSLVWWLSLLIIILGVPIYKILAIVALFSGAAYILFIATVWLTAYFWNNLY